MLFGVGCVYYTYYKGAVLCQNPVPCFDEREEGVLAVIKPDFIFPLVGYSSSLSSFGDALVEMFICGFKLNISFVSKFYQW